MQNSKYYEYCYSQLTKVFKSTKAGRPDITLKHRTEGMLLAGEILGVMNKSEASKLIEKAHFDVFGEYPEQRAKRQASLRALKEASPDEYFDIPAIQRRK